MPFVLMHAVALALAATVTLWLAPLSLWRKSEPTGDTLAESPSHTQRSQNFGGLHIRHEMVE